jgi:hypothetical protein
MKTRGAHYGKLVAQKTIRKCLEKLETDIS